MTLSIMTLSIMTLIILPATKQYSDYRYAVYRNQNHYDGCRYAESHGASSEHTYYLLMLLFHKSRLNEHGQRT
jgi:hypothetical protein